MKNTDTTNFELIINIKTIINKFKKYNKNKNDIQLIEKAFHIISKSHEGQFRKSKEPYVQHLMETANILVDIKSTASIIATGMLHDILEDTNMKEEDLEKQFGTKIKNAVIALTKVKNITNEIKVKKTINYEYAQQLIVGMLGNPGIIIVKLADRLHNMRTLMFLDENKRKRIATETMEIFVPLAHKLAIHKFKSELEDLCFFHLNPKEYYRIKELIENDPKRNTQLLEKTKKELEEVFAKEKIEVDKIYGRKKHYYSVYRKMQNDGKKFSEILDFLAIRIITKNKEDCYKLLGLIHNKFRPIPTRLKDFISMPKENLYRALHTTVIVNKTTIEIQIRDEEMEETANYGAASHFLYKSNSKNEYEDIPFFKYVQKYADQYNNVAAVKTAIIEDAIYDIFNTQIQVLTPTGEIVSLPKGATVLDYAFKLHTDLGLTAQSAIINGVLSPLSTLLSSGDMIEINSDAANELKPEAFNWVFTKYAQNNIKKYFNKKNKFEYEIKENFAKQIINEFIEKYPEYSSVLQNESNYSIFIKRLGLKDKEELWASIVNKKVSIIDILNSYFKVKNKEEDLVKLESLNKVKKRINLINKKEHWYKDIVFEIEPQKQPKMKICNNCMPVFGEKIAGELRKNIFSRGMAEEIMIHRENCYKVKKKKPSLKIKLDWNPEHPSDKKYQGRFKLIVVNRPGILIEVYNMFNKLKINVVESHAKVAHDTSLSTIDITFKIKDIDELSNLFTFIKKKHSLIYDIIRK